MSFSDLVAWTEDALDRLAKRYPPARLKHVRSLHGILTAQGDPSSGYWLDWHVLAVKCAALLEEDAPEPPTTKQVKKAQKERKKAEARPPAKKPVRYKLRGAGDSEGTKGRPLVRRRATKRATDFEISEEFRTALDAVTRGEPLLFVTGRAGTGKSTFIRYLQKELDKRNLVVLAPTGIAALNAGGQTIHSFFRFPPKLLQSDDVRELEDPSAIRNLEILVIDEISMVRADVLDAVDASLRLHRRSEAPFGGVQLVVIGDLFQLPPVVIRGEEADAIASRYATPFFFGAHSLVGLPALPVELTRVYRQEDPDFVEVLGALREGRDVEAAVAQINRASAGRRPEGRHLMLVTRNDAADRENAMRLAALPGRLRKYSASSEGDFQNDRLPAPRELALKRGAQVMFTRNDAERRWVNGTTGVVESLDAEGVRVKLDRGEVHDVGPETWESIRYQFDDREKIIVPEVVGSYTQIPLMAAWAVTIHKAQGLTLDAAHVDFGGGAFAEGQAYVALSRCRRMSDLTLERPLRVSDVRSSAAVRAFYRAMRRSISAGVGRIVAWDIGAAEHLEEIVEAVLGQSPDVVVLITTREDDRIAQLLTRGSLTHVLRSGALLIASRIPIEKEGVPGSGLVAVHLAGFRLVAAAVARGEEKLASWDALEALDPADGPTLIIGNLNTGAHHVDEDGATMIGAARFEGMAGKGWTDLWRRTHGSKREFTWYSPRGRGFRLDHALASPGLLPRIQRADYSSAEREAGLSDHSMVIVDL